MISLEEHAPWSEAAALTEAVMWRTYLVTIVKIPGEIIMMEEKAYSAGAHVFVKDSESKKHYLLHV